MVSQATLRWILVCLACCVCSHANAQSRAPTRILLTIGQNIGEPGEERLRYGERDAERMAEIFTSYGDVSESRRYVIADATAERVRETLAEIRGRARELNDVILLVYVSSHADSEALHLRGTRLSRAELDNLVASVPARLRIVVVDGCSVAASTRTKGGKTIKSFAIDFESAEPVKGRVLIASSSPNEPAQEWESLGGSLFTHHLMSALRGAADRDADGRVTLFEAYSYAYDHTLADSAAASAGIQHPSHDMELRGAGDFALTRPGAHGSSLVFAAESSGRYVISSASGGELIAEVDKPFGRTLRLAVSAGSYLVRKPEGRFVRVGEFVVLPGASVTLRDGSFSQVPYTQVVERGGSEIRPWTLEAGAGAGLNSADAAALSPRVGLELQRALGRVAVAWGVSATGDDFRARSMSVTQRELWSNLDARARLPLRAALLYGGLRLAAGWIHQSFVRVQEDAVGDVFGVSGPPDRDGLALQSALTAGAEILLHTTLLVRVEGAAGLTLARVEGGFDVQPAVLGRAALGFRF